ncbi:RNA 3'-terminal phosphate cyclase [Natrarchaeobius chitinivorans]|uniref:RNA 3'-terminal phosphate cyclase n=1 Tax=Natrarchaeobius chitinivorans TaxID=1679083 RepID=A0A3N6M028_NATCH|nr:RNA 3'-terminal phosphate cyclase [Natrarchaeobius chitinivorans]RQG96563.1 RNA 3'-terminal phosphate cyclase [Natrarchaeobius chitinivorans]
MTTRRLDGSNAGGQFLRTALGLSVRYNEPIHIEHVRGDRPTPGLGHQHLATLETVAELCDADVTGAQLGSECVEFDPNRSVDDRRSQPDGRQERPLEGGRYRVDIGTAGSISLLLDALAPLAAVLESPLSITVTGGTDVKWSPPIDYLQYVKLPLLRRFGLVAACEVDRRGFCPDGGGHVTLHLAPSRFDRIDLVDRGPLEGVRIYSTEAVTLADSDVASRQADGALERLRPFFDDRRTEADADRRPEADADRRTEADVGGGELVPIERRETTAASDCPGTAIVIRTDHEHTIGGFTALGERGKPAERVGEDAADAAIRYLEGNAAVDRHMADQLLPVLALAGGRIRIPAMTDHVALGAELLESFGSSVECERDGDSHLVTVSSP